MGMIAKKAELVLLKIGDGANPVEQFTTLGGLRTTRMIINRQVIPATDVTAQGWRSVLERSGTAFMRVHGVGVFTATQAENTLREQALNGTANNYELYFGSGDKIAGAFVVSNYERSGKVGELESFAVTLESVAAISYAEA
jgi:predicted secreted protein